MRERDFTESELTRAALERLSGCGDARLREIAASLIRHLHDFVREVGLGEAEWLAGIRFLTATGQLCDERRQEFILLSDVLGVSMLVNALANRRPVGATPSTVLGPFYRPGAAELPLGASLASSASACGQWDSASACGQPGSAAAETERRGEPAFVSGRVLGPADTPVAGATLDVWQTDAEGLYDVQRPAGVGPAMRGVLRTDAEGRFWFRTVKPVSYAIPSDGPVGDLLAALGRHPYRPAHLHVIASAPGLAPVTTHVFVDGDPYLDSDAVFGVKSSLVASWKPHPPGSAPDGSHVPVPFYTCEYDIRLADAASAGPAHAESA